MTPIEALIRQLIAGDGPMRLDRYMGLCLGHPLHGYYMTRDPFGAAGDFVTAPEVSQMFGELIGVWCVSAWQELGAPAAINLVELGPGRGTLMADLLRAARVVPQFAGAASVHLVETSPVLRAEQKRRLGEAPGWHETLATVPEGPAIFIANEFFDAVPIRQIEWRDGQWWERCVGVANDSLALGLVPAPSHLVRQAPEVAWLDQGMVFEVSTEREAIAGAIGTRLAHAPGAALIIDYGHATPAFGDTLQAVRRHAFCEILSAPGEADLTSHVDFESLRRALAAQGARMHGPISQRQFLIAMGIEERSRALEVKAGVAARDALERLAGEAQMGNLFKVAAASGDRFAIPYPFQAR